ncbi:hypothetical protein HMPREF1146_1398 [Prevotella sp. MSX73]|nr:hypothetical protein HMPREF1146_1398 [Prevotella sp. MSX73]
MSGETKKGDTCVLPLLLQRYDENDGNANQMRFYLTSVPG